MIFCIKKAKKGAKFIVKDKLINGSAKLIQWKGLGLFFYLKVNIIGSNLPNIFELKNGQF
jgi:hypothetical protein